MSFWYQLGELPKNSFEMPVLMLPSYFYPCMPDYNGEWGIRLIRPIVLLLNRLTFKKAQT